MTKPAKLRCAVYTRKSTEEGLEQTFNSLHAQREACEAYIRSQAGEGWSLIRTAYDDGGFSGGSMDRPAVRALMADIEAGRIDVVVVYKVDRLTRSLTDFSRMVEAFDRKGVSFVSVTQAFNTTTSMGRLTLNVLLSFAQFEREVTGERIRDKIAASKAKGMWMGGNLPLGYNVQHRQLLIVPEEAETVRMLFRRYLELGAVNALLQALDRDGVRSKLWTTRSGKVRGGLPFSRGALFHLLKNRIYLGEIVHRDRVYPGQHPAIVDAETFEAVQARLAANSAPQSTGLVRTAMSPLTGRLFDETGARMTPSFAYGRAGRTFRYYTSTTIQRGRRDDVTVAPIRRVSAPQLEALVAERMARLIGTREWPELLIHLQRVELRSHSVHLLLDAAQILAGHGSVEGAVETLGRTLDVGDRLMLEPEQLLRLAIGVRPVFRGGRTWMVNPEGSAANAAQRVDKTLITTLQKAHRELAANGLTPSAPLEMLVEGSSPGDSYIRKIVRMAFLAPDIQAAIIDGRQPAGLTTKQIIENGIPAAWADQRVAFGFA